MEAKSKGFTLIEVTVALGILTIVLAAMVQLIVNTINLAMVTRYKTEATALSQKGLTYGISAIQNCQNNSIVITETHGDKRLVVTYDTTFGKVDGTVDTLDDDNFIKVISTVSPIGAVRGSPANVINYQYVRIPE